VIGGHRECTLEKRGRGLFDVLVIGDGIVGGRVAFDAARAGLRVALEQGLLTTIYEVLNENAACCIDAVRYLDTSPKTQSGVSCVSVLFWGVVLRKYASSEQR